MQIETMTLKDFDKIDVKPNHDKLGYAKKFREFINSQDEVLKISFESVRDARSCNGTMRNTMKKMEVKCRIIVKNCDVYVIKEG